MDNPNEAAPQENISSGPEAGRTPPPVTRLRTYKDDIAGAVQADNISAAKIFLAEEDRRQRQQRIIEATSPETPKNRFLLWASAFLVLAAAGGFTYFRFFYQAPVVEDVSVDVPTFIRVDKVIEVPAMNRSYRDVQTDVRKAVSSTVFPRQIYQIALSEARDSSETGSGEKQIGSDRLFGAIGAYPPAELLRSIGPDFFIGVYGSGKGNLPFLIMESVNPALSRASMLDWESTMAADLSSIFPSADAYAKKSAAQPGRKTLWADAVYQNRDARVLSVDGQEVLLWGFGDSGAIIVAADPFILPEMASRLSRDRELH